MNHSKERKTFPATLTLDLTRDPVKIDMKLYQQYSTFFQSLKKNLDQCEHRQRKQQLKRKIQLYSNETLSDRMARAKIKINWEKEDENFKDCCNPDTCYYAGKWPLVLFRLPGTINVRFCDVCLDNDILKNESLLEDLLEPTTIVETDDES